MTTCSPPIGLAAITALAATLAACSSPEHAAPPASTATTEPTGPPPRIRAWMDRLTVEHAYDPDTGFIIARETIGLPAVLADAPPLDEAIQQAGQTGW